MAAVIVETATYSLSFVVSQSMLRILGGEERGDRRREKREREGEKTTSQSKTTPRGATKLNGDKKAR